ncbi:MAG: hypothetical protein Udaeo2_07200 [Candidatus Udaeobacter sp.]|nr:MAG: hypothetical protein Udaeo2_07200 [Candidatus Udaeobacter sp.]
MSTTQNTPSGQDAKVEEYDLVTLGGGTGGTVARGLLPIKAPRRSDRQTHNKQHLYEQSND